MKTALHHYLSTPYRAALFIFASTILIHGLFWLALPENLQANQSSDFQSFYEPVARNLLLKKGLYLPNQSLAIRYPPGYPVLLAGVFSIAQAGGLAENTLVSLFMLICLGGTAVFIYGSIVIL